MSQLLLMFIPALALTNVISLPQHCFGITHWKPGAVSLSWHTELIKSEFWSCDHPRQRNNFEAFPNQKKRVKEVISKELCCVIQVMNLTQARSTDSRLCLMDYISCQRNCSSLMLYAPSGESWEWGKRDREGSKREFKKQFNIYPTARWTHRSWSRKLGSPSWST